MALKHVSRSGVLREVQRVDGRLQITRVFKPCNVDQIIDMLETLYVSLLQSNQCLTQGLSLRDIVDHLKMNEADVWPVIEKLLSEGYMYTTIDDGHFMWTTDD
jgi:hypothetical protein